MKDIPRVISRLIDNRPVRWAEHTMGGYAGCDRTLEVFNVDAAEQLKLLHKIRQAGTSGVVIFHTCAETARI